jgi:hypothetical protein
LDGKKKNALIEKYQNIIQRFKSQLPSGINLEDLNVVDNDIDSANSGVLVSKSEVSTDHSSAGIAYNSHKIDADHANQLERRVKEAAATATHLGGVISTYRKPSKPGPESQHSNLAGASTQQRSVLPRKVNPKTSTALEVLQRNSSMGDKPL